MAPATAPAMDGAVSASTRAVASSRDGPAEGDRPAAGASAAAASKPAAANNNPPKRGGLVALVEDVVAVVLAIIVMLNFASAALIETVAYYAFHWWWPQAWYVRGVKADASYIWKNPKLTNNMCVRILCRFHLPYNNNNNHGNHATHTPHPHQHTQVHRPHVRHPLGLARAGPLREAR